MADAPSLGARRRADIKAWDAEQLRAFLEAIRSSRLFPAFHLSAHTGMRRGEVLGLRWGDLDAVAGRLSVRQALVSIAYEVQISDVKTGAGGRTIDVDDGTVEVMAQWRLDRADEHAGFCRVRVAVDGLTAAGKTSLGHELAQRVADAGRIAVRASLDDFKRPWSESHLYDRVSGEGYYRNAFDSEATRRLLLDAAGPDGSGRVALCSIDPLTQIDHSSTLVDMPGGGVLIVDGVFAFRPQLDPAWDLRIWVHIDPELSVRRSTARDAEMEGGTEQAEVLHRDRYLAAETIYIDEVDPMALAEVVIDNTDFERPLLIRG